MLQLVLNLIAKNFRDKKKVCGGCAYVISELEEPFFYSRIQGNFQQKQIKTDKAGEGEGILTKLTKKTPTNT